jgi:hypothetical protein
MAEALWMMDQGNGQEVKQILKLRPHIQRGFGEGTPQETGAVFTFEVYHTFG